MRSRTRPRRCRPERDARPRDDRVAARFTVGSGSVLSRRGTACRPLELELPQLDPPDLPRERLRQVLDELDSAWIRVRRQALADEGLDLGRELVGGRVTTSGDDERLDDIAAELVGRRDRGRFLDARMLEADGLDLERADAVARRDDHVVGAALVPDVAVLVLSRRVLRVEPVAAEVGRRVVLAVP